MSELNDILSQLHDAQASAQSAESNADDASSTAEECRDSINRAVDYANNSSGYANDAAEHIDSVINAIQCYIDAKNEAEEDTEKEEQATKSFIDVLEYLDAKLDTIKSTVASANNLVSNARRLSGSTAFLPTGLHQATKSFIDVLEYLDAKLDTIKSTVASANNLVSNALLDMKNENLPLQERSERLLEASTDEAQEETAEYA